MRIWSESLIRRADDVEKIVETAPAEKRPVPVVTDKCVEASKPSDGKTSQGISS